MKKALVITPPFLEPFRPPISGAIVAEVARQAGCEVEAMDLSIDFYNEYGYKVFNEYSKQFSGMSAIEDNALKDIDTFLHNKLTAQKLEDLDYILISVFSKLEQGFTNILLEYIRPKTKAKIIIGGSGVAVHKWSWVDTKPYGQIALEEGLIDYWVKGEGEVVLKELLNGNDKYPGINGIMPTQINDIENLPLPNYDFYDLKKYDYLDSKHREIFIYGSRGCVKNCSFCDIAHFWPKYRYRSGKSLAEEMIMNYEKYGVNAVYFADSLFNGSVKVLMDFMNRLAAYPDNKNWRWGGFAIIRPKHQHPKEMWDLCKELGNSNWVVGLEHGSHRIRKELGKDLSDDDIWYHFEQSERSNVTNTVLVLPTWPSETLAEHEEHKDMFRKYQRFVASGAIVGLNISQNLFVFYDTPFVKERHFDWAVDKDAMYNITDAYQNFWINKANPDLTIKERTRRVLALYEAAMVHKYPLMTAEFRLHEIKGLLETQLANPSVNRIDNLVDVFKNQ